MNRHSLSAAGRCALLFLVVLASPGLVQTRAGAQSPAPDSYVSPQFGYQIVWRAPWFYVGANSVEEADQLILSDGVATANVIFSRPGDTPLSEIAGFMIAGPDDRPFTPQQLATDPAGAPIQGETVDRAWEAWLGQLAGTAAASLTEFRYGEARRLDDEIAAGLSVELAADDFDGSVERYSALLDGIRAVTATPAAGTPAASRARLVFDPQVTNQNRELIAEAVRLAEDFFTVRLGATLGDEVTVTALPIPSPRSPYLIAATLGSSIVVYTQSRGWLESPPAERVRTVVHEYTHAYQFWKVHTGFTESAAWFEEGLAEYLSLIALSDLGLVNQGIMEGYFGVVVNHSELPPLQELEAYDALQAQPGEVYPLAYFGVAYLLRNLPRAAVDDYYTSLEQGSAFAAALEGAFGVDAERFYDEFARFRASELPLVDDFPAELKIPEGIDQPSAVTPEETPRVVMPGSQAVVVARALPGSNCTLDLTAADTTVAIDDRETFANGEGEVFWLLTIPDDLPTGRGAFALACGADPVTLPVLVS